jgi:two-component system, cell cycle response regulator DivK
VRRIAVIEDNADNRLLARAILEGLYQTVEYESGPDALAGMRAWPPALVLLDISLPVMDGTEVLQHMRADAALKELPVIALTAHAMAGDREKYLGLGFDAYVAKPILDERILLAEIDRLLKRRN